ncbi:MAG: hypothetical protein ABWX90_02495 [Candidatus Saccharimonadales bacterium]
MLKALKAEKKVVKKKKTVKVEKEVKRKKAKTDPNVTYVFYVTDIHFWQVIIMRYQLVKKTEKYAMVYDATFKKIRIVLNDADGVICDDFAHARTCAKLRIADKQKKLKEYQGQLDMSKEAVKQRAIHDVVPRKLSISAKDYEF